MAISCRNLVYAYRDGYAATRNISFDVEYGEVFCVLGPNGAGKSTLIKQITGSLAVQSGNIKLAGLTVDAARASRRIGIVPQDAGLFAGLTVGQHLKSFARLKGLPKAAVEPACHAVASECGLLPLLDRRCGQLSGGQQRLALLALALLGDPEVLALDEPTVGLDPVARSTVWRIIERLRDGGRAVLLTTHYLDEAEKLATRVGFVSGGQLSYCGTLNDLRRTMMLGVRLIPAGGPTASLSFADTRAAVQYAGDHNINDYTIERPSLEQVYLRLLDNDETSPA